MHDKDSISSVYVNYCNYVVYEMRNLQKKELVRRNVWGGMYFRIEVIVCQTYYHQLMH